MRGSAEGAISMVECEFASRLSVEPDVLWQDVTSLSGISAELGPFLRMDSVDGLTHLAQLQTEAGVAPLVADLRLAGVLPLGRVRIEIVKLGRWHVTERSDQPGMKSWQHQRSLELAGRGCLLVDRLQFAPGFAPRIAAASIRWLFAHRHARLRARWSGGAV